MHEEYELGDFIQNQDFPFFIQYGRHESDFVMHSHRDFYELTIVLAGEACHIVENESIHVKRGDVFVIHGDTVHGYSNVHNFRICNIMFREEYFRFRDLDIGRTMGFQALFYVEPGMVRNHHLVNGLYLDKAAFREVHELIDNMNIEFSQRREGCQTMLYAMFYQLLVMLSRQYPEQSEDRCDSQSVLKLAQTVAWIEANYQQDISVKQLAKDAGYSERHLNRLFNETYHTTPLEYIYSIRVEHVCRRLRESKDAITDIAIESGFNNMSYFYRIFKNKMHISPGRYRKDRI